MEREHMRRDVKPDGGGAEGLIMGVVGWTDGEGGGFKAALFNLCRGEENKVAPTSIKTTT